MYAQIDAGSRLSHDQSQYTNQQNPLHNQSNEVLPPLGNLVTPAFKNQYIPKGASNKVAPFYNSNQQHIQNSYMSSDDQSFTPAIITMPKARELRLRTAIGLKESGYISATGNQINRQSSHLMAIENMSQVNMMNSDIESMGDNRLSQIGVRTQKGTAGNKDGGFYQKGERSISMIGDIPNTVVRSQHNYENGRDSMRMRSMTLQNQGA